MLPAATIAEWDLTRGLTSTDGKFELKARDSKFVKQTSEGVVLSAPDKDIDAAGSICDVTSNAAAIENIFINIASLF